MMGNRMASHAPAAAELRSDALDERRKGRKPETVVLIPTYGNPSAISAHIGRIAGQEWKEFDVIIVYGEKDRYAKTPEGASILHVREKGRLGCSGAYYLAERMALDEGYRIIIEADDDCLPENDALVGKLAQSAMAGAAITLPRVRFGGQKEAVRTGLPHYYGCFRRECFEKAGLTFLPFHFGGEDIELIERMEGAGFAIRYIDEAVSHPRMRPILINPPDRSYYYYRGEVEAALLSSRFIRAFSTNAGYLAFAAAQLAFGNVRIAATMVKALWDASGMRFCRENGMDVKTGKCGMPVASGIPDAGMVYAGDPEVRRGIGGLIRSWLSALSCIGRPVMFNGWVFAHSMPAALVARSAYIAHDGAWHAIFEGRGMIGIAAGMAVMASACALVPFISLLLVARGALYASIRRPENAGYGIRGARLDV